ncbi:helix-turn-helix transcriptional regulator [Lacinutrix neustonica]|uniref:Helix-turn-helix transcriptional regulator n=1 Tax=Lacinutrix neustonica TaxID=2980107 RepID=A0A9E8MY20_9FLAO|nr:helix-turn-helix transcriptional regulator [Lacinutrix neustonica]WAC02369.1 helix-turn-helix transcriptional regulator [Lacinutrix neustonica]
MINNEEFTNRLKKVIEYYSESASSFAEEIGVQRSSISHILSGRNKPSLEFVLKILSTFPEVELYWLMNGKGKFPSEKNTPVRLEEKVTSEKQDLFSEPLSHNPNVEAPQIQKQIGSSNKEIDRVIIFYKDGSFSNFENS